MLSCSAAEGQAFSKLQPCCAPMRERNTSSSSRSAGSAPWSAHSVMASDSPSRSQPRNSGDGPATLPAKASAGKRSRKLEATTAHSPMVAAPLPAILRPCSQMSCSLR